MFQYFFSKILAAKTNSSFSTSFNLPSLLNLKTDIFYNLPERYSILKEEWVGHSVSLQFDSVKIEENFKSILDGIQAKKCDKLLINGYFQNYAYYIEEMDFIKKSFNLNFSYKENTLGIHVRKGDIENTLNDLPDEWFTEMVKKYPLHKKYVTTDSPNSRIIGKLLNMGCELYQESPEKTILDFSSFSDLILSQGSFSWWMAFLSEGEKNFLVPNTGWNSKQSSTNLFPKIDKWKYHTINESGILIDVAENK